MNNYQEHNLLRTSGKFSQLKLRHQLIRLIWGIAWKASTILLPANYGGIKGFYSAFLELR